MAFAPVFQRPFGGSFDRHAAVAAAAAWYTVLGKACVAAYQPKGAASLAASYVNLANPGTYDAAPGSAPTWNATDGWIFDGVGQYLNAGFVPGGSGWSLAVRYTGAAITTRSLCGAFSNANANRVFQIIPYLNEYGPSNAISWINNGGAYYKDGATASSGVIAVCGTAMYKNGVVQSGTSWYATGTSVSTNLYIGAQNQSGSAAAFFDGEIQALAVWSATLTAGEAATVSAAMAAL